MYYCQHIGPGQDGEKTLCGSDDTKVVVESKYSIVYHCNVCRMNSIILKDMNDGKPRGNTIVVDPPYEY